MKSDKAATNRYRSKVFAFGHFVWATKGRFPFITVEWERRLYRAIVQEVQDKRCAVLAIGGMPDHVHLVVRLAGDVSPSDLMKQAKGATSALMNDERAEFSEIFRWQDGYAFYSIGQSDEELQAVIAYVRNQKSHHANQDLWPEWEETNEKVS